MPMTFGMVEDPIDVEERAKVAHQCVDDLDLPIPALIDGLDDSVNRAYGGWPDRLYLVGKDGRIAYAGGRGPFGFRPGELEDAIEEELARIRIPRDERRQEGRERRDGR
ncbi:MAG: hypothetical protein Fur0037_17390 [Planctomycetota bacterium]